MIRDLLAWLLGVPRVTVEIVDDDGCVVASKRVFWVTCKIQGKMFNVPLHHPVMFSTSGIPLYRHLSETRVHAFGSNYYFWQPLGITLTHKDDVVAVTIQLECVPGKD